MSGERGLSVVGLLIDSGPQIQAGIQKLAQLVNLHPKRLRCVLSIERNAYTVIGAYCLAYCSHQYAVLRNVNVQAGPRLQAGGLT